MWLSCGAQFCCKVAQMKAMMRLIYPAIHLWRRWRSVLLCKFLIFVFESEFLVRPPSIVVTWACSSLLLFFILNYTTSIPTVLYLAPLLLVIAVYGGLLLSYFLLFSQLSNFDLIGSFGLTCTRMKNQLIILVTLRPNQRLPFRLGAVSFKASVS